MSDSMKNLSRMNRISRKRRILSILQMKSKKLTMHSRSILLVMIFNMTFVLRRSNQTLLILTAL